jgi:biopolymer transport protein ExbD
MWKIVQELIPIVLVVLLLTQYVLPLVFNQPTWWLFRPSKSEEKPVDSSPLEVQIKETQEIVDETKNKVEDIRAKVDENLKTAEDLKKDADKLL